MSSHKIINQLINTLTSDRNELKILAASGLSTVAEAKNQLEMALYNEDPDVVIAACQALEHHYDVDQDLICRLVEEHTDTDVRLAGLSLLKSCSQGNDTIPLLLKLLTEDNDQWLDEWNSSFDIQLAAASNLLSLAAQLSCKQIECVIDRILDDPEPELSQQLYYLLAQVSPKWLKAQAEQADRVHLRQITKATEDKVLLYHCSRNQDIVVRRHGIKKLAQLNAKEYLQDFLQWLSSEDSEIFHCAASCLLHWQYPVDDKYLQAAITAQTHKLDCIEPFIAQASYQALDKLWQEKQIAPQNIALFLRLSQIHQCDLEPITREFYQRFSSYSATTQIDTLHVMVDKQTRYKLSLAFIRLVLQSNSLENGTRRALIEYLTLQDTPAHQAFLKQIYFEENEDIAITMTKQDNGQIDADVGPISNTPENSHQVENATPTSTLEALLNPSPAPMATPSKIENPLPEELSHFQGIINQQQHAFSGKGRKKVAKIASVSNKQLAQELCLNKDWIKTAMAKQPTVELIKACIKADIGYDLLQNETLDEWLLGTLKSPDREAVSVIVNWMENGLPEIFMNTVLSSAQHNAVISVLDKCCDVTTLEGLVKHSYIGIKQQAYRSLVALVCTPTVLRGSVDQALQHQLWFSGNFSSGRHSHAGAWEQEKTLRAQLLNMALMDEELIELVPNSLIEEHQPLIVDAVEAGNVYGLILAGRFLRSL